MERSCQRSQAPEGLAALTALKKIVDNPELFASGTYKPVLVEGPRAGHVLAFTRSHRDVRLTCAFMIRAAATVAATGDLPPAEWWRDTHLVLDEIVPAHRLFAHEPFLINLDKGFE